MRVLKAFVIYDSKAESYGVPFFDRATGMALRGFSDEVNRNDGKSAVASHPEDFTLFEIGEYDEQSASFRLYEAKKSLGLGLDFVRDSSPVRSVSSVG